MTLTGCPRPRPNNDIDLPANVSHSSSSVSLCSGSSPSVSRFSGSSPFRSYSIAIASSTRKGVAVCGLILFLADCITLLPDDCVVSLVSSPSCITSSDIWRQIRSKLVCNNCLGREVVFSCKIVLNEHPDWPGPGPNFFIQSLSEHPINFVAQTWYLELVW